MSASNKTLIVPVLLITFGVGWLLTALDVVPRIDWIWTLGVLMVGGLTFAIGGIDKVTVVVGPFFILAAAMSILRQSGRLSVDIEVPLLVIAAGVLLMVARSSAIPAPKWLLANSQPSEKPLRK